MEKKIHLDGRLLAISEYVDGSRILADIGCDHGRLSVSLLQSGRTGYVYARDISAPSLQKARLLAEKCGLTERMQIEEADGLRGLSVNPDTIVIAGMGGLLIASILKDGRSIAQNAEQIILQPMRGIPQLRRYLHDEGYLILRDRICEEAGRLYQVMDVRFTGERQCFSALPDGEYDVGEYMLMHKDKLLPEYVNRLKNELSDALAGQRKSGRDCTELENRLKKLEETEEIYYEA